MSTLCRFVLPSTLSPIEDACVAEFNEYKKRKKEIAHNKSSMKRLTNTAGGITTSLTSSNDSSRHSKDATKNPEQAKEEAKRLLQSGLIKVQPHSKDQGFKRAASNSGQERIPKRIGLTPSASPSTANQTNPFQPVAFVQSNSHENKRHVVNYDDTDNY